MARTLSLPDVDCFEQESPPPQRGYVNHPRCDDSPYGALLWMEIYRIERIARLTAQQAAFWEWHLLGLSNAAIADAEGITEGAVRDTLSRATSKVKNCGYVGILTCVFEDCGGLQAVRDLLSDRTPPNLLGSPKKNFWKRLRMP